MRPLRIISAAVLLMIGSIRSTVLVEQPQDLRVHGSIGATARAELDRLSDQSDGAVRFSGDGRIVLRRGTTDDVLALLTGWADRHGLELPEDPTDGHVAIHAAEAVVDHDDSQRGDAEQSQACTVENSGEVRGRVPLGPRPVQAASWHDWTAADPSAPRAPPAV